MPDARGECRETEGADDRGDGDDLRYGGLLNNDVADYVVSVDACIRDSEVDLTTVQISSSAQPREGAGRGCSGRRSGRGPQCNLSRHRQAAASHANQD